jgi:glycerate kinase
LTGDEGAALFAQQKGASEAQMRRLEAGLRRFAEIVRRDIGVDVELAPGAGAAGGLGAGLAAFAGADLVAGARTILDTAGFDQAMEGVDLVVTGEGRFDAGSLRGKGTVEVAGRARCRGIPALILCARWSGAAPPPGAKVLELGDPIGPERLKDAGRRLV